MPLDRSGQSRAACAGTGGVPQEHAQHLGDVTSRDARPPLCAVGHEVRIDVLRLKRCQVTTNDAAPAQERCRAVAPLVDRARRQATFVAHPRDEAIEGRRECDWLCWWLTPPAQVLQPWSREVHERNGGGRRGRRRCQGDRSVDDLVQAECIDVPAVVGRHVLGNPKD